MKRLITILVCAGFAGAIMAQGPRTGPGEGQGPGKHGSWMRFGSGNTSGWSLMTPQERKEHHDKMMSAKSMGECTALHDDHRKMMEQRAKEKNKTLSQPKHNMCEMMEKHGAFK